jgi:hypothetical protein
MRLITPVSTGIPLAARPHFRVSLRRYPLWAQSASERALFLVLFLISCTATRSKNMCGPAICPLSKLRAQTGGCACFFVGDILRNLPPFASRCVRGVFEVLGYLPWNGLWEGGPDQRNRRFLNLLNSIRIAR